MKKSIFVLVIMFLLVGCSESPKEFEDSSNSINVNQIKLERKNIEQENEENENNTDQTASVENEDREINATKLAASQVQGNQNKSVEPKADIKKTESAIEEPRLIATVKSFESLTDLDEEMISTIMEFGFESPFNQVDVYLYTPTEKDIISYRYGDESNVIIESLVHKGFTGLEVIYEHSIYDWDKFMGDISYTDWKKDIIVRLKGNSIYEEERFDEYAIDYRYYLESKGVFYEVKEVLLGDLTGPKEALTKRRDGMSCNYLGLEGIKMPTHNPFIMDKDEEIMKAYTTLLDSKPCVYLEIKSSEKLIKKWISIQHGIVIKEVVFDHKGIIIEDKVAKSIIEKAIKETVFYEPQDIAFKDITLFIYMAEGGDIDTLFEGLDNTIPNGRTGIVLTSEAGEKRTIYTSGMKGGMKLSEAMYVSKYIKEDGTELTIKEMAADRFYTIIDELQIVEIYDVSCYEEKFFNFEDMGLIEVKKTDKGMIYTFYDPNNLSVSELYNIYEYEIENDKIVKINTYMVESILSKEKRGYEASYKIDLIPMDETVWDDSVLNTYKIIDYGQGSFNDGEHMPFWMQ